MNARPWLLSLALLLLGCSDEGTASDDGLGLLCTPDNYVFCRCDEVSYGTKRCSRTGKSFGPCTNCQSGEIPPEGCIPGTDSPCLCDDGTEGVYTCLEDGASFDACRDCGAVVAPGDPDICPGVQLDVLAGEEVSRTDSTSGAIDHFAAKCSLNPGPDLVYRVVPAASGFLTARAQGLDLTDPVLFSWGSNCGGSVDACSDSTGSGSVEEISLPALAGEPIFFGVDTAGGPGTFSFSVRLDGGGNAGDLCPGIPVALGQGAPQIFSGSTASASADFDGALACAGLGGGDVVYAVQPSAPGLLVARLEPQGFDGALYIREGSCDAGPQIGCASANPGASTEIVSVPVSAGQVYSVFVDGPSGGAFELSLELAQEFCGDGDWAAPEQCDDGNKLPGDGCSPECKVEQNPPDASCPGVGVFVADTPLLLSGSTDAYGDFEAHPSCGGAGGPDRVFRVVPTRTGTLRAAVTSTSFDLLLYARQDDCSGPLAKDLGCDDKFLGSSEIRLDLPVAEGAPLWLVVDGYKGGEKGVFALSLSIE